MQATKNEWSVEVDDVTKNDWQEISARFADATLYQTWAYDVVRHGPHNVSHLVLRRCGDVVAAAQLRLVRVPIWGCGIAYARCGPVWRRSDKRRELEHFR